MCGSKLMGAGYSKKHADNKTYAYSLECIHKHQIHSVCEKNILKLKVAENRLEELYNKQFPWGTSLRFKCQCGKHISCETIDKTDTMKRRARYHMKDCVSWKSGLKERECARRGRMPFITLAIATMRKMGEAFGNFILTI